MVNIFFEEEKKTKKEKYKNIRKKFVFAQQQKTEKEKKGNIMNHDVTNAGRTDGWTDKQGKTRPRVNCAGVCNPQATTVQVGNG